MTTITKPSRAGRATPEMDEATGQGGFREQGQRESRSDSDVIVDGLQPCVERTARLRAELAQRGFELRQLPNGAYMVHRWGRAAHLTDLDGVAQFARRVGVPS